MKRFLLAAAVLMATTIVSVVASDSKAIPSAGENATSTKEVEMSSAKAANSPDAKENDAVNAREPAKDYGLGADPKDAVKISEVLENPQKYLDREMTVAGLVVDVCPKRGCWMLLAGDKKFQTLRIKVNDGVMVFPLSARGHEAAAKGKLSGKELTREKAIEYFKHLADEKSEKFDPADVTGPVTFYMLMATGVTVR